MAEKSLVILEVSQKQSYIFASNKLRDNIERSNEIAHVTGTTYAENGKVITNIDYIQKALKGNVEFSVEDNLVFTGGGHTVLEFPDTGSSKKCIKYVSEAVLKDFPEMELFATSIEYENEKPGDAIGKLTEKLEKKKSLRAASFHQGSFGVEQIDTNSRRPIRINDNAPEVKDNDCAPPDGFVRTRELNNLGISENESSFIAVVHIDGNAMGKRLTEITNSAKCASWDEYKKTMRNFSEGVAIDFKECYYEVEKAVARSISDGELEELNIKETKEGKYLPIRRIISEGDDICFVTDGRIGIECAYLFLKFLASKCNKADGKEYSACAGVALVHSKYPFYRAYELSEQLCSNAKRLGASLSEDSSGQGISSIDWHIDFGELKDTLDETREQYITADNKHLEIRPYIVCATDEVLSKEKIRLYESFRKLMKKIAEEDDLFYSRKSLKELRPILKKGSSATEQYLKYHKIESLTMETYYNIYKEYTSEDFVRDSKNGGFRGNLFTKTLDGTERCLIYDAIETMDTFMLVEGRN